MRQVAVPISEEELAQPEMQALIDRMFRFARGEQDDIQKTVLVGLAAPQIGISKRLILVDVKANGKGGVGQLQAYINPEVLDVSPETEEWYEGCFSTGKITGIVARPRWVKIRAFDRLGRSVIEEHVGYCGRIFQHEIDHLNGIRFPQRVTDSDKLHVVEPYEFPLYRNDEGWRRWERKCPPETLKVIQEWDKR